MEEEYVPVYARPAELKEAEAIEEMEAEAAEAAAEGIVKPRRKKALRGNFGSRLRSRRNGRRWRRTCGSGTGYG